MLVIPSNFLQIDEHWPKPKERKERKVKGIHSSKKWKNRNFEET